MFPNVPVRLQKMAAMPLHNDYPSETIQTIAPLVLLHRCLTQISRAWTISLVQGEFIAPRQLWKWLIKVYSLGTSELPDCLPRGRPSKHYSMYLCADTRK